MTNFFGPFAPNEINDGFPGAAPTPGAGNLMQGNPAGEPSGTTINLPGNQNCPQQLLATQLSSGNVIASSIPVNVNSAPGTDSLLAQMSRGQVILKDSTYGMSQFIPGNAASPNNISATVVPVVTGPASGLSYPTTQQNYTGN